jgi:hypothetical protein
MIKNGDPKRNNTFRTPSNKDTPMGLSEFESSSSEEDMEFSRTRNSLMRSFNKGKTFNLKDITLETDSKFIETGRADSINSANSDSLVNIRTVHVASPNTKHKKFFCLNWLTPAYKSNKITTSKYNVLTFLPLNLMLQFSKFANLYFLILMLMECIPLISDSGGVPVLLLPLSFVVGISMIKDIYEDYIRYRSDNEENNRKLSRGVTGADK